MVKVCIIFSNTDNKDLAYKIASELISNKLAACVTIDEVMSIFEWEDQMHNREEFRIMIKAKNDNYAEIEEKILSMHNDKAPELIKIDITAGLSSYLSWINKI